MKPYYEENGIVIYHGRCEEILPMLQQADHVITDPPYSEHTHSKQWIGSALTKGKARNGTKWKGLGFDALSSEVRLFVCQQAKRITKRWSLFFSDLESTHLWVPDFAAVELDYVRTCIWDKVDSAPQFTGDRPAASAEAIVLAHQPGRKKWNGGGRRNVFRHCVNGSNQGSKPHPSCKPEQLMTELISLFTDEGETIVDPFMGSGTTLRAAKDLGRNCIGIEQNEEHAETAARRLSQEVLAL